MSRIDAYIDLLVGVPCRKVGGVSSFTDEVRQRKQQGIARSERVEGQHTERELDAGDEEVTETSHYGPCPDRSCALRLSRVVSTRTSETSGQCSDKPRMRTSSAQALTWLVDGWSGASCRIMRFARQHGAILASVKTARSEVDTYPAVDVVNRTRLQEKRSRKDARPCTQPHDVTASCPWPPELGRTMGPGTLVARCDRPWQ